jgi:DinB superfamily
MMSTTTTSSKTEIAGAVDARLLARVLEEGYGPGAWHGPDLRAALAEVNADLAFWRPAPGRHNIAEIALHHAYCVRGVRGQLGATPLEPFVLPGEDWFELTDGRLPWPQVRQTLEAEQRKLLTTVRQLETPASAAHFELVLGVTGHAIYHAGQVQLIRRLHAG